jgi:hypothetical protein
MEFLEILKLYGPALGGGIIFVLALIRGDIVTKREFLTVQQTAKDAVDKAENLTKELAAKQDAERAQLAASLEQASKEREQLLATLNMLMEKSNVPRSLT